MKNTIKLVGAIITILCAFGWSFGKYSETHPSVAINNGNTGDPPAMSEATQQEMRKLWEKRRDDPDRTPPADDTEREQRREAFEKELSPAAHAEMKAMKTEREKSMATMKAALSPEEQEQMREKMKRRGGRGRGGPGGGGPGGGGPGGGGPRGDGPRGGGRGARPPGGEAPR